jgi:signal transduction histidine kinase
MQESDLIILVAFISPLFLSALLIWFFISYQKKQAQYESEKKDAQLREQELIIENQKAIEHERNRIAGEMHDELGSGLTIIRYLSDGVIERSMDESVKEDIHKIANYSTVLVSNMSEIIWAMNSRYDNLEGLVGYLRRYIVEYLEDHKMDFSFQTEGIQAEEIISGEKRRNIYLVVKEVLHNSIKYSKASKINITIHYDCKLTIIIEEVGGVGFDPETYKNKGNGLYNIEKRMQQIEGYISYNQSDQAMNIQVVLPFPNVSTDKK